MLKLLWEWWLQIWPNLAASVITVAVAFPIHHYKIKQHIERLMDK